MTRERSRVTRFGLLRERVIEETHERPGKVGAERVVDAAVDDFSGRVEAERVGFCFWVVHPRASHAAVLLENDDVVALALKLTCRDEARDAGSYDRNFHRTRHCVMHREEERDRFCVDQKHFCFLASFLSQENSEAHFEGICVMVDQSAVPTTMSLSFCVQP